ncbi:MAG: hypothetical protein R3C30_13060 [Hyphomonadaceae bacterium]
MSKLAYAAAAFALISVPVALAQEPDIVVVGERLEAVSREFATEIGAPSTREDQLARWDERVCVGASGLAPEQSRIVVDRLSARAAEVGLRIGEPNCRANIMVIFATDSDAVARTLVSERRDLMGYYTHDGVSSGGREGLEAFANTPRAVRWWQVARNVTADGRVLDNPNTTPAASGEEAASAAQAMAAGQPPAGIGAFNGAQGVRSRGSRLYRETRQDLNYIVIIVDTQRIAEFPTSAVLDYISMVALAQVNPAAEPSMVPSILNLFTAPIEETPEGMTDWDLAYLRGLYRAARDAPNSRSQVNEIARSMAAELSDQP